MLIVETHCALDMFLSINPDIKHAEKPTAVEEQNLVLKIVPAFIIFNVQISLQPRNVS